MKVVRPPPRVVRLLSPPGPPRTHLKDVKVAHVHGVWERKGLAQRILREGLAANLGYHSGLQQRRRAAALAVWVAAWPTKVFRLETDGTKRPAQSQPPGLA